MQQQFPNLKFVNNSMQGHRKSLPSPAPFVQVGSTGTFRTIQNSNEAGRLGKQAAQSLKILFKQK